MGTLTAYMSLQKPTLGGDSGTWDDQLNDSFELIDAHNHTTGKGVKVPTAGININADLAFSNYSAYQISAVAFVTNLSFSTYTKCLWVKTDNELYWRSSAGVDVKITSGATLNTALIGGIGGDYGAASASVYYDDTADTYRFLSAAPLPNVWSSVSCGDIDLYEKASGISTRVRLSSPTALAASYALTFPAALPSGSRPLSYSSTDGALRFGHDDIERSYSPISVQLGAGGGWSIPFSVTAFDLGYISSTASGYCAIPIVVDVGERLKSVKIMNYGDGAVDLTINVYKMASDGTLSDIASAAAITDVPASWQDSTIDVTDTTCASGDHYYIRIHANAANARIGAVRTVLDYPA